MLRAHMMAMLCALVALVSAQSEPMTIRMMAKTWAVPSPNASDPRSVARRAVFDEFHRLNPDVQVANAGGLELPSDTAEVGLFMSMAGDTAPDVFYVNFRQYYNFIDQGFCRPLDDLLQNDQSILGRISPEVLKVLRSYDGHIYAAPFFQVAQGLYYRRDHFIDAGLDPDRPPKDWDEFLEYGRRLTASKPGRNGFAFGTSAQSQAYWWVNFLWQAGGDVAAPTDTGVWRSAIATPAGATALEYFRRLTTETWTGADGQKKGPISRMTSDLSGDIAAGKVSMWFSYTGDVVLNQSDIPASLIGIAQMPAGPAGHANEVNAGMWAINARITDPKKLYACWRFVKFWASQEAAKISAQRFIDAGLAKFVNPNILEELGRHDLATQIDPSYAQANVDLFKHGHPEPYGHNCQQVYSVLDNALERARHEKTPAMQILQQTQAEMDRKLLGYTPPEVLARQRGWATGLLVAIVGAMSWWAVAAWRKARQRLAQVEDQLAAGTDRRRVARFLFWCLIPAAGSILLWSYVPLARGLVIAFQDFKIINGSHWVGLDNFIEVFTQPVFYRSVANSLVFVSLSVGIGFLLPVFLAVGLNEIPRYKVLFRTLYYLPAMTSSVVVAFLWRQIYDRGPQGLLNSLLDPFAGLLDALSGVKHTPLAVDWLGDPKLAMLAVVLPGIWAGAGPGSILYLAALKQIPDERYEAADLDGASWVHKLLFITFPGLRPLMMINLLGAVIGGFKAMESIFVLTGGGPVYATHVLGLEIWTNAFQFLKFGYATAAAWVMGAMLIGFTLVQMRSLTRLKFSAGAG
ncbi:MAG: extracellular solute-binding protein [Armatimonadetes bacterium]|nr:extracellular solute-binding protein [Armatimonadota bacterium]